MAKSTVGTLFEMDPEDGFEEFLEERSEILKDIEQFLLMVFKYFSQMEKDFAEQPNFGHHFFITENVCSLIESLCVIHGLYGYPGHNSSALGKGSITVNKQAIKTIVLNKIKDDTKAFVDFYKKASTDKFWQFNLEESIKKISCLREPAHIFLELVRDPWESPSAAATAAKIGRDYLGSLPDVNFLKPVVWAEHVENPECCGVSLGVRTFVRPLFLYLKLMQLRNTTENKVKLEDVGAFQSALKKKILSNRGDPPSPINKRSEYNNEKRPCENCQVFFQGALNSGCSRKKPSFPPFGNCAEYDVIHTKNLDYLLQDLQDKTVEWTLFETACQHHFKAFMELTASLQENNKCEKIKAYYMETSNARILKYKKIGPVREPQFTLFAKNWRPDRRQVETNRHKRRKTVA